MILFLEDWSRYKNAIVDVQTTNKSFLRYAGILKAMGIENNAFCLALHNPLLQGIDARDENNLTQEQKIMIATEVQENPWYFFREVVVAPAMSSLEPILFRANRGNIALFWCFFANVRTLWISIRQTGKSFSTDVLMTGLLDYWIFNTTINLLTKDASLRAENVDRLKRIEKSLPEYLQMSTKKDANNTEMLTRINLGNKYKTAVAQASEANANKIGRGLTSSIFHIDEFPFIDNIATTLPAALAAGGEARENAERSGLPYGTIFTSTAGNPDTKSGAFAFNVYKKAGRWSEKYFDCKDKEEVRTILSKTARGKAKIMLIEFNHKQLGFSDEWLKNRLAEAMADGADAERDFFNIWSRGSKGSPFDPKLMKMIDTFKEDPHYVDVTPEGFILNWYIAEEDINKYRHKPFVFGLDTSDAIGNDGIGLVGRDITSGEVIVVGKFNELNLDLFGEFIFNFLMKYERSVMIAEKKSSAMTIIDKVARLMQAIDVNPFKRLFNWVVNDREEDFERFEELTQIRGRSLEGFYIDHKKQFGYTTAGSGKASRDNLYGEALIASLKYTGNVLRDKDLVSQIAGLTKKNGRIDHKHGENDDLVIAAMLTYYFLTKANNVEYYGIDGKKMLSNVMVTDPDIVESMKLQEEQKKEKHIRDEIDHLLDILTQETNPIKAMIVSTKIKKVSLELSDNAARSLNVNNRIKEIVDQLKRKKRSRM